MESARAALLTDAVQHRDQWKCLPDIMLPAAHVDTTLCTLVCFFTFRYTGGRDIFTAVSCLPSSLP